MTLRRLAAGALCALAPLVAVAATAGVGSPSKRSAEMVRLATANEHLRLQIRAERRHHRVDLARVGAARPSVDEAIHLSAVLYGLDESRMRAIIWRESRFRPWAKNPHSSASGLAQFLDSTFAATPCGRAGMSPFSAYASALCMGWYIAQHGWSAWALTDG